jgi:hypothetical protein
MKFRTTVVMLKWATLMQRVLKDGTNPEFLGAR